MSSFSEVDENLEETQFVDAVNGYDSSVNDDSAIGGEFLEEDEPFENEPEQDTEETEEMEPVEEKEEMEQTDNITFTVTDGSMNVNREYYARDASMIYVPIHKDLSMNNVNINVHNPIPRRPNHRVFNRPVQRPGQHLRTMFF